MYQHNMKSFFIGFLPMFFYLKLFKVLCTEEIDLNIPAANLPSNVDQHHSSQGGSNYEQAPIFSTEKGQNRPTRQNKSKKTSTKSDGYHRRIEGKVNGLIKFGIEPETAKELYLRHRRTSLKQWRQENREKVKMINQRYHWKNRDSLNATKRMLYHEKSSNDPSIGEKRRKMQKEMGTNTEKGRYESNIRTYIKKGMSEQDAKEAAIKKAEERREKRRLYDRNKRQRLPRKKQ